MVYINDTLTEYDHLKGTMISDEALKALKDILNKDSRVIFSQDLYSV